MTQEDRKLLLKDLNARLSYGVKVTTTNPAVKFGVMSGISIKGKISVSTKDADIVFDCTEVKPYLRPLSYMTEEEKSQYNFYLTRIEYAYDASLLIDWCNKNHFDYHGLIPKGLAIEVTEENNPYK